MPKLRLITHPITNEVLSLSQWADKLEISLNSLHSRLKKYPLEIALSPCYLSNKGEPIPEQNIKQLKAKERLALSGKPSIPLIPCHYYESELPNFLELPVGKVKLTIRQYPKHTRIGIHIIRNGNPKPLFILWPIKYLNEEYHANYNEICDSIRNDLLAYNLK